MNSVRDTNPRSLCLLGPVQNVEQLIEALVEHPELWDKDQMKTILVPENFMELCFRMHDVVLKLSP